MNNLCALIILILPFLPWPPKASFDHENLFLTLSPKMHLRLQILHFYCQTPVLGLGLGVDFTFAM